MNDEELIERIVALNYREFGASVGNDLKRIIIKKENELDKYKNIVDGLEKYLQQKYCEYIDMESDDAFVISLVLDTLRELKGE